MIEITQGNKQDCCGCSACAQICPGNCISMQSDEEGFSYPVIDKEACIQCGLCEKVCPILQKEKLYKKDDDAIPQTVGGWHKDDAVRGDSSSGGAFSLFALDVIRSGGIVFGAALDENFHAGHIGVENEKDLAKLRGSKYVQSEINTVYQEIKENLLQGRQVLFSGTPCQAAGLSGFLGKKYDNLYIIDFICHGVPSPKVFQSYLQYIRERKKDDITAFQFRLKDRGWSQNMQLGTGIHMKNGSFIRNYPGFRDSYMNGFLDDLYLRPSCYQCEFKCLPKYYADITIADFWGVKKVDPELYDGKGTSLLLLHTEPGKRLFDRTKKDFFYKECDFNASIRRNLSLIKAVSWNPRREKFFRDFKKKTYSRVRLKYMTALSWGFHKSCRIAWSIIEKLIKIVISPVLNILGITWNDENWESFMQFVKFSMVGVTNALVSYGINVSTLLFLRPYNIPPDYIIANITAFILSVLWSYNLNSRLVFKPEQGEKRSAAKTLLKTYISYGFTGIFLNNILATFWIKVMHFSKFVSPLLNLPVSVPINFFMNKLWAYSKKEKKQRGGD